MNNIICLIALCLAAYFSFEARGNEEKAKKAAMNAALKTKTAIELINKAEDKITKTLDIDKNKVAILGVFGMIYKKEISTEHIKGGFVYEEIKMRPDYLYKLKGNEGRVSINIIYNY